MINEKIDCIDCGSEYCPCHLAESGECLICSQLQGKCFCDCVNWEGVCVYQELFNNGGKARKTRKTYNCTVIKSNLIEENLLELNFIVPHKLAIDLIKPGSYIFIRTDNNQFFDIPISVLESNIDNDTVTTVVEIRGIKTKRLLNINKNDTIVIRAPYFNGVFGIKDLCKVQNSNVLVLGRGIGLAPMTPVVKKLCSNNNEIDVLVDYAPFNSNFVKSYIRKFNIEPVETNLITKGNLSKECEFLLTSAVKEKNVSLIHIAGADILTYNVIKFLDDLGRPDILLSCCNNFKMCCGEGICGACTNRYAEHKVKRFCKLQCSPRSIFEGRRFI